MGVIALVAGRLSDLSALPTPQLVTVPFLLGISSHLAYFKHGEHDLKVFTYLLTFIVTSSTLYACLGARTAAVHLVVHIGMVELIVMDAGLLPALAKARKGTWYIIGTNNPSLQTERGVATHAIRRHVWDRAFTPAAVDAYIPRILPLVDLLLAGLAGRGGGGGGGVVNISKWISWYSFDAMGEITYGRSFGMLARRGEDGSDRMLDMTHAMMGSVGAWGHVPWAAFMKEMFTGSVVMHLRFLEWAHELVVEREQRGMRDGHKDLMQHLLDAESDNKHPHYIPLRGDSRTAVVAGRYMCSRRGASLDCSDGR